MGIESPVHLVFIGVVALLVLGPKRLPEVARALGHSLREFREMMNMDAQPPIEHQTIVSTPVPDPQMPAPQPAVHGDPLAESFTHAETAGAQVDPAPPVPSPDAPDRRTV